MADHFHSHFPALQQRLGYVFRSPARAQEALTHPSFLQDHPQTPASNQRLEFLGDSVLQLVLTEQLFALYPAEREGVLSQRRSALTKGVFLAQLAREIGVDHCLRLGVGEEMTGGRGKAAVLEDAFEALLGALYLDSDLGTVRDVLRGIYGDLARRLAAEGGGNPKGRLQERVQPVHGNGALRYELVSVAGADHARVFEIAVYLHDRALGRGSGSSKKLAEEEAARAALLQWAELPDHPPEGGPAPR